MTFRLLCDILFAYQQRGEIMAKMGRPKSENPKDYQVGIRFNAKEKQAMEIFAQENQITVAEVVRRAVRKFLKVK